MNELWTRYHEHRKRQQVPRQQQHPPHLWMQHRTQEGIVSTFLCRLSLDTVRTALGSGLWMVHVEPSNNATWCQRCIDVLNTTRGR